MDVSLTTERLILRPQVEADIGALMRGLNDYEVTRFLTVVPYPYRQEDAEIWIAMQAPPTPGQAIFAIDLPGEGMIGAVSIEDELGYWLDRRFHGHGYMTEASAALLSWHFAALPDDIVHSGAHVGNHASLNVQRKLGFINAGTSMRHVRSQNREIEHVETILARSDFEAAQHARMQRWM
jgi:RimJ/RimL family protein N-acetyltransferase